MHRRGGRQAASRQVVGSAGDGRGVVGGRLVSGLDRVPLVPDRPLDGCHSPRGRHDVSLGRERDAGGFVHRLGIRADVMGTVEYAFGRLVAFTFVAAMFFSLYKFLPNKRIRWPTALLAAVFTSSMFEIAKNVFTAYVAEFNPGSIYTGTLYALVIVVFWVYYAAMIFILGGEVAQVYELRRVRRLQRETFEE